MSSSCVSQVYTPTLKYYVMHIFYAFLHLSKAFRGLFNYSKPLYIIIHNSILFD